MIENVFDCMISRSRPFRDNAQVTCSAIITILNLYQIVEKYRISAAGVSSHFGSILSRLSIFCFRGVLALQ